MLTIRRVIVEHDGVFQLNQDERQLLDYYANSIIHLCPPPENSGSSTGVRGNRHSEEQASIELEVQD